MRERDEQGRRRFIDPALTAPHYSTQVFRGYLAYLQERLGPEKARALVEKTGVPWDFLDDGSNWVSEEFADRFYQALSTDPAVDADFSYRSGKKIVSREIQGPIHLLALQLLEPAQIYRSFESFTRKLNKVDSIELLACERNRMRLRFGCRRKTAFFKLILENWHGILENVPQLLALPTADCAIVERGDREAVFEVRWKNDRSLAWLRRGRFLLGFPTAVLALRWLGSALGVSEPGPTWLAGAGASSPVTLLSGVCLFLAASLLIHRSRAKLLAQSPVRLADLLKQAEDRYAELHRSKVFLDRRYRESHLLADVIRRINSSLSPRELIETTLREVQQSLGYDRVLFMEHLTDGNRLAVTASQGLSPEQASAIGRYSLDLGVKTERGEHLGNVFKEKRSVLVPVTKNYWESLSPEGRETVRRMGSRSFLACTVASDSNCYGLLLVDYAESNLAAGDPGEAEPQKEKILTNDDLYFINSIAKQLAISLDNAKALETEKRLRAKFQSYVPKQLVRSILGETDFDYQTGTKRQITVLFSDIRDFTALSSQVPPEVMVAALNHYFEEMTQTIVSNGGIVDKFIGDAVLALFNAFGDQPEHSLRAVRAAVQMQEKMPAINRHLRETLSGDWPCPQFEVGIGIHCGPAIVGNLGSTRKQEYTAIGTTVNIAHRIESHSKGLRRGILVSEEVHEALSPFFHFHPIGSRELKGLGKRRLFQVAIEESRRALRLSARSPESENPDEELAA
jgi:class 3 adenylate cyclase